MSSGVTKYLQVTRAAINNLLTIWWLLSEFLTSASALAQPPWADRQLPSQHGWGTAPSAGATAGSPGP